jgi:hypothetical protein
MAVDYAMALRERAALGSPRIHLPSCDCASCKREDALAAVMRVEIEHALDTLLEGKR